MEVGGAAEPAKTPGIDTSPPSTLFLAGRGEVGKLPAWRGGGSS